MICKNCYEVFLNNNIGRTNLFEEGDESFWDTRKIIRVSDNKELKFVKLSRNISEEEFEKIKQDRYDSHFFVLCRKYRDKENNIIKIEYL
jgi:hypothetical protein